MKVDIVGLKSQAIQRSALSAEHNSHGNNLDRRSR